MASGESAEPIYRLIEELDCTHRADLLQIGPSIVFQDLIKFLPGETIKEFVDYFRRNHDMKESIVQTHFDPDHDEVTEDFENCVSSEETQPPIGSSRFFSSRIPEC